MIHWKQCFELFVTLLTMNMAIQGSALLRYKTAFYRLNYFVDAFYCLSSRRGVISYSQPIHVHLVVKKCIFVFQLFLVFPWP